MGITTANSGGGFWASRGAGVEVTQPSGLEPGSPGSCRCSWRKAGFGNSGKGMSQ